MWCFSVVYIWGISPTDDDTTIIRRKGICFSILFTQVVFSTRVGLCFQMGWAQYFVDTWDCFSECRHPELVADLQLVPRFRICGTLSSYSNALSNSVLRCRDYSYFLFLSSSTLSSLSLKLLDNGVTYMYRGAACVIWTAKQIQSYNFHSSANFAKWAEFVKIFCWFIHIVTWMNDSRRDLGWWLDLLNTYTHNSYYK
jgi:hypothetical protein